MPNDSMNTAENVPAAGRARPDDPERRAWIAEAAYYRAERRGFVPGGEIEDWLEAEREIETAVALGAAAERAPAAPATAEPAKPLAARGNVKARASRGAPQRGVSATITHGHAPR